jgi:hypothetical protein
VAGIAARVDVGGAADVGGVDARSATGFEAALGAFAEAAEAGAPPDCGFDGTGARLQPTMSTADASSKTLSHGNVIACRPSPIPLEMRNRHCASPRSFPDRGGSGSREGISQPPRPAHDRSCGQAERENRLHNVILAQPWGGWQPGAAVSLDHAIVGTRRRKVGLRPYFFLEPISTLGSPAASTRGCHGETIRYPR